MKFNIAAAQMGPNQEEISENLKRILKMMDYASANGVEVISFPELSLTPFFPVIYSRHFKQYLMHEDDDAILAIREQADRLKMIVIFGFAEEADAGWYNSALVIDGYGNVAGKYRKMHIPSPLIGDTMGNFEKTYFKPGDLGYPVIQIGELNIGIQICYDRHFPEGFRMLAKGGANVVFNLTATSGYNSKWRSEMWELLLRARAFENNIFVVGVNKSGSEYGQDYYGHSMIISPLGAEIVAFADRSANDVLMATEVDLDDCWEAQLRLPFCRDLRDAEI